MTRPLRHWVRIFDSGSVYNRPNKFGPTKNGVVGRNLLVPGALTGIPPDKFDAKLSHYPLSHPLE